MLSLEELRDLVERGEIDTVIAAFTDMQGRLLGKRLHGEFFVEEAESGHEVEGCNYLLALDMDMDPVPGYEIASWEQGYGDFGFRPDLSTLRRIPWLEATALVLCDVEWHDGSPVQPSPRQVLKAQLERASAAGYTPMTGSELEFYVVRETYREAWDTRYGALTPSVPYILDYHVLASTYDEGLLRQIRNGMQGAGMRVESSKGEAWPGQHEVNFHFADALTMADDHVVYKNGAKEIAFANGCALTFMAKPFETWIGNSCHIHASLFRDGQALFGEDTPLFERFLAGQIACFKELAIFLAPTINSYKRYAPGTWAPTTLAWGNDNRTCGFRVVGHGPESLRVESRVPGADCNPYLAFAATIAAGLHGLEHAEDPGPRLDGNAYRATDAPRVPSNIVDAIAALEQSKLAVDAFGAAVHDHLVNTAQQEWAAFGGVVTDWERRRSFEQL